MQLTELQVFIVNAETHDNPLPKWGSTHKFTWTKAHNVAEGKKKKWTRENSWENKAVFAKLSEWASRRQMQSTES